MSDVQDHSEEERPASEQGGVGAGGAVKQGTEKKSNKLFAQDPNVVALNDKISIFAKEPLENYSLSGLRAYRAVAKVRGDEECFAVLCEKHLVPRVADSLSYTRLSSPHLAGFVDSGPVFWPPLQSQCYVAVFNTYVGKPIVRSEKNVALGWDQAKVESLIARPLILALQELRNRDFVHGNIRLSNIFIDEAEKDGNFTVLGDCLSTSHSYAQPVEYLTIERGMADPLTRGYGSAADDVYAFGVCVARLMRSVDPLEGLNDRQIVQAKIEHGSYVAVTGKDRFTGSVLELLRGVLHDDPWERWTIEEVLAWADGRRLSPKQTLKRKRAPRVLSFREKKYYTASHLAMDLPLGPQEVVRMIDDDGLLNWLQRSLKDEELLERFENSITQSKAAVSVKSNHEDMLISNLSIALDPAAPIRYKSKNVMPDGIGYGLVSAIAREEDVQPYAEILSQGAGLSWLAVQFNSMLDVAGLVGKFDRYRAHLRHQKIGYGLERVIYESCPDVHCLSPVLSDYIVMDAAQLILAFDDLCGRNQAPSIFIDRHVAAFLLVRQNKSIEHVFYDLSVSEPHRNMLANLKCMGAIQQREKIEALPDLAQAFLEKLSIVLRRYHDKAVREKLKKDLEEAAAKGDLMKMASALASADLKKQDLMGFRQALAEYHNLKIEAQQLKVRLAHPDVYGRVLGKSVSAILSWIVALLGLVFIAFVALGDKGPF